MMALAASSFAANGDMDLYLLIAQSNMAGRGVLTDANRVRNFMGTDPSGGENFGVIDGVFGR